MGPDEMLVVGRLTTKLFPIDGSRRWMGMDTIFSLPGINPRETLLRLHVLQD
jgi:hypothetical protein